MLIGDAGRLERLRSAVVDLRSLGDETQDDPPGLSSVAARSTVMPFASRAAAVRCTRVAVRERREPTGD